MLECHLQRGQKELARVELAKILALHPPNAEELSPLHNSERLLASLKGAKQMVVYQESRHSVGNVPAANLGPFPPILVADWLTERLAGKPFASERWFVRSNGEIEKAVF